MPSKRKKTNNDLKLAADPLGRHIFLIFHQLIIIYCCCCCYLDDILRKNLFLSKYVRSADQLQHLGKSPPSSTQCSPPNNNHLFFPVQEVAYERVLPTHNAATLQASTEFNFVIPPRTDYFTRFKIPSQLKK